jgi:2-hydroxy-4-carboxymuconate semialdehyde hemiacetal dehydrogenase
MHKRVRVALAGPGAFGVKHLEAIRTIDGVDVVVLIGADLTRTQEVAAQFGVERVTTELDEALRRPDVDAVILCTPTPMHAAQAAACLRAGKHVEVEIPMADSLSDAAALAALQKETSLVAMVGHTRRFNPGHQWMRRRIEAGKLNIQHMDVQTFFFRRANVNALGQPRAWTDHLLWHHAAHTVDLFAYQTRGEIVAAHAMQGPRHPELGIAMDMSIQLKSSTGAICTLALSFNNDGPLGTVYRYICDNGTYIARYDDLVDGQGTAIAVDAGNVSLNGVELQDREFFSAIRERRQPSASFASVLPCYRVLADIERQLASQG